jgi:hypothetical protein
MPRPVPALRVRVPSTEPHSTEPAHAQARGHQADPWLERLS